MRVRIVALAFAFICVALGLRFAAAAAFECLGEESLLGNAVGGSLTVLGLVALTIFARRKRPAYDDPSLVLLPRRGSTRRAAAGALVGAGLFAAVFGICVAVGGIEIESRGLGTGKFAATLAGIFAMVIANATWEEYAFRGWAFSASVHALGSHAVALGIGTLFGLVHLLNPHASATAVASVALAGYLLGYAMLAAKDIAVPVGIHIGWNFVQLALTSPLLWSVHTHGGPLRSGGEFGLEASAAGIAVTGLAAAIALVIFLHSSPRIPIDGSGTYSESGRRSAKSVL